MALTNAEHQKRHRERVKARLAQLALALPAQPTPPSPCQLRAADPVAELMDAWNAAHPQARQEFFRRAGLTSDADDERRRPEIAKAEEFAAWLMAHMKPGELGTITGWLERNDPKDVAAHLKKALRAAKKKATRR